jgi:hypothetical protein
MKNDKNDMAKRGIEVSDKCQQEAKKFCNKATHTPLGRRTDRIGEAEARAMRRAYGEVSNFRKVGKLLGRDGRAVRRAVRERQFQEMKRELNRQPSHKNGVHDCLAKCREEIASGLAPAYLYRARCSGRDIADVPGANLGWPGDRIKFRCGPHGYVKRIFQIEEHDYFPLLRHCLTPDFPLWRYLDRCQELSGRVIQLCMILGERIRGASSKETGLGFSEPWGPDTDEPGLNDDFVWTVYAEAVGLLKPDKLKYSVEDRGDGTCVLSCAGHKLAVVDRSKASRIQAVHERLRGEFRDTSEARELQRILGKLRLVEKAAADELDSVITGLKK